MSRYDGLIIPRSYSEYINKTDAATLQQALQLSGVLSGTVAAGDNKAVKSDAVNTKLQNYQTQLNKIGFRDYTAGTGGYYKIATITTLNAFSIGALLIRGAFHTSASVVNQMCNTFEIAFSARANNAGFSGWFYNTPLSNDDIIAVKNDDDTTDIYIKTSNYTRIVIECDNTGNANIIFNQNIIKQTEISGTLYASAKDSSLVRKIINISNT